MNKRTEKDIIKRLETLFKDKDNQPFIPYFYEYYQHWNFGAGLSSYVQYCYDLWKLSEAPGKEVLDTGCGFGLTSVLFKAFGSSMAVGLDQSVEKIGVCNEILRRTRLNEENIIFVDGDCLNLPFDEESFDVILAIEVISHVRDLNAFINEVWRVLRSGGTFFVSDGNNVLNPAVYLQQKRWQIRSETGPVNGTGLSLPYVEARRRLIKDGFPNLSEDVVDWLVRATKGLWGQQIVQVVEHYVSTGSIPTTNRRNNYVNPLTGEFQERLFDPIKLSRLLKTYFDVKLIAPLPTRYSSKINKLMPTAFKYMIFPFTKSFQINARKRHH